MPSIVQGGSRTIEILVRIVGTNSPVQHLTICSGLDFWGKSAVLCGVIGRRRRIGLVCAIHAIFWDVGGVLLSNAWDHSERKVALEHFGLDQEQFHSRHEMVVSSFERGKISLDEYLQRTIFYRKRPFSIDEFRQYMYSLSESKPESIAFARALTESRKYFMGTINNESRELNVYRIQKFGLREIFELFVSSCFVGLRKPESAIYRLAIDITQFDPRECCFIDDRALNLECAEALGMRAIQMQNVTQLRDELAKLGVTP
jgi:putative hydrolase of the HAD superfamily